MFSTNDEKHFHKPYSPRIIKFYRHLKHKKFIPTSFLAQTGGSELFSLRSSLVSAHIKKCSLFWFHYKRRRGSGNKEEKDQLALLSRLKSVFAAQVCACA
jgi:hypothetical protein